MGRPKLLLPWGNTSVLGHLLRQWTELGARQIAIICAANKPEIPDEFKKLSHEPSLVTRHSSLVFNPAPDRGMFSSIQCAASWTDWDAALTHWIITLGDQPHLRIETLRALLEFGAAHPEKICQPMRHGRRKHPVLLPRRVFVELKKLIAGDLKTFLEAHANDLVGFESDDAGLDLDMDTPEDYERLKSRS